VNDPGPRRDRDGERPPARQASRTRDTGAGRTSTADVVVGACAALVVFAAVPSVLVVWVGLPLPHEWTRADVVSLRGAFDLLAVVAWCAWGVCAWTLLRSVTQRVKARDISGAAHPLDRLAVRIAIAFLAISPALAAGSTTAGASTVTAPARVEVAAPTALPPRPIPSPPDALGAGGRVALRRQVPAHNGGTVPAADAPTRDSSSPGRRAREWAEPADDPETQRLHRVRRGEGIIDVARGRYADPGAWRAIAAANCGRVIDGVHRLIDPTNLEDGWLLALPTLDEREDGDDGDVAGQPADVIPVGRQTQGTDTARATTGAEIGIVLPQGAAVPELAGLGVGVLLAALMARRARRAQRLRSFVREEGDAGETTSATGVDLAVSLDAFEQIPLPGWLELGMRHLTGAVAAGPYPLPQVEWVRAGNDAVEVALATPSPIVPRGWQRAGSKSLVLPTSSDVDVLERAARDHEPWCPVLLPIGDDERGSWLLPLAAGMCVAVVGPSAQLLIRAMRMAVTSWTWHEEVVVTDDPQCAEEAARAARWTRPDGSSTAHVLFVGDPRRLSAETRAACATLTPVPLSRADVTILVDRRAATVHPFGISVRPHRLREASALAFDELGHLPARPASDTAIHPDLPGRTGEREGASAGSESGEPTAPGFSPPRATPLLARPSETASVRISTSGRGGALPPLGATRGGGQLERPGVTSDDETEERRGRVEVRLLSPVPGIVGLQSPLPSKRARRAIEVVAYLAVHSPHPVTGDRLRTRVLGSADADAAAKTLFNIVGAARRALGLGPDGAPLLPPASNGGQYRVSHLVTVDAIRMARLLASGLSVPDRRRSISLLREGLAQVRGEPLAGVLTGYAWWRAEGHERRAADLVVDAACALARESVRDGRLDVARWAIDQARLVEQYSEALTRAAMQVAAASGDAGRLRAEWLECRRQVDELDPGGAPSEPTERLYVQLRERLREGGIARDAATTLEADAFV